MSSNSPSQVIRSSPHQPLPLLAPMEVGELLDEAFDLYKKNFRLFIGIAAFLGLPLGVLLLATPPASGWRYAANAVSYVAGPVTSCALTYAALERHLGRETTIAAAYRLAFSRFLRLFSAYLIYGLALSGGLIALVIPAVFVALWALLLLPIVVVENRGGTRAFQRARQLATGNVWRLFFLALGLGLVVLIFLLVLLALAGLAASLMATGPAETIDRSNSATLLLQAGVIVVSVLFQAAWSPVLAAAQMLVYLDLRLRREAYDVELLASAVEARAAAARSPAPPVGPTPGQVGL